MKGWLGLAIGFCGALAIASCEARSNSAPAAATVAASVTEAPTSAAARIAAGTREAATPAGNRQELILELARLKGEVAALQRERDQYKAGLEQAVAELNRVSQDAEHKARVARLVGEITGATRVVASPPAAAQARDWGTWAARVSSLGAPTVQILGQQILVTGTLWNAGDLEAQGRVTVTLLLDNRPVEKMGSYLAVPARAEASYSQRFNFPGNQGTYSATVSFQ